MIHSRYRPDIFHALTRFHSSPVGDRLRKALVVEVNVLMTHIVYVRVYIKSNRSRTPRSTGYMQFCSSGRENLTLGHMTSDWANSFCMWIVVEGRPQ